jgi:hypothetical protein
LGEEDGDLVLVDGEEKLGGRFAVEVGEVGAFEGGVGGQGFGVGEVEAEGETDSKVSKARRDLVKVSCTRSSASAGLRVSQKAWL